MEGLHPNLQWMENANRLVVSRPLVNKGNFALPVWAATLSVSFERPTIVKKPKPFYCKLVKGTKMKSSLVFHQSHLHNGKTLNLLMNEVAVLV